MDRKTLQGSLNKYLFQKNIEFEEKKFFKLKFARGRFSKCEFFYFKLARRKNARMFSFRNYVNEKNVHLAVENVKEDCKWVSLLV